VGWHSVMHDSAAGKLATAPGAVILPDPADWDSFVALHHDGHLLQSSGWGALKARFGWKRHMLAAIEGTAIRAGALVLERRRFGLCVLYVPRGPLFSGDAVIDRLLLDALDRLARRQRAVFARLEPNVSADDERGAALDAVLLQRGMRPATTIQPRSTIHLALMPEPERLLAAMSKGHRADIKRAAREGVEVRAGGAPADLDAFYAIMQATGARAEFAIHARAYYAGVLDVLRDAVRLWLADHRGVTVAAAITAAWGQTAVYLYSGSTAEGLRCGAQHAIQWQAIQWARTRGATCYDFWGIPDGLGQAAACADPAARARLEAEAQNDPLYGVYRFKKGFGGSVVRYLPAYDRVFLPPLYALWRQRTEG